MNIYCNGKSVSLGNEASLHSLLEHTGHLNQKGIAAAVNNCLVKKDNWKSCQLQENDKVIIVSATKGG